MKIFFVIFSSIYFAVANADAVLISLSGLPGRGKSAMVKQLMSKWEDEFVIAESKIFNAGNTRREEEVIAKRDGVTLIDIFANNQEAKDERNKLAMTTLDNALKWLEDKVKANPGKHFVAFFDATNSDLARRVTVAQKVNAFNLGRSETIDHFFLESIGDDQKILSWSFRSKKTNGDHGDALREKLGLMPKSIWQFDPENVKIERFFEATVIFGLLARAEQYRRRYDRLSLEERAGLIDAEGNVVGDYISITDCGQEFGPHTLSDLSFPKAAG